MQMVVLADIVLAGLNFNTHFPHWTGHIFPAQNLAVSLHDPPDFIFHFFPPVN